MGLLFHSERKEKMNVNKKLIESGKTKFLIKASDQFIITNFLNEFSILYPEYKKIECFDTEKFINVANEINLFDDSKHVIVLSELIPDSLDPIYSIINNYTDDIWVLIQRGTLPRNKSFTNIKSACNYISFKDLTDDECASWVRTWLEEINISFSEDIPQYIVSRIGTDPTMLRNEVKKLKFYYNDKKEKNITKENCDKFFPDNIEVQFFDIINNLLKKRVKEVIIGIKKIDEYSYIKFLHLLISQVRKIYQVAIYKEQRMSEEDIATMMSLPKFIIKIKMIGVLSVYNKVKLMQLLDLLNTLDVELRQTKFPKELIFHSYLLKAMNL